jgi:hypothetical protein
MKGRHLAVAPFLLALSLGFLSLAACHGKGEIDVTVQTNAPCSAITNTMISIASGSGTIEGSAVATGCTPGTPFNTLGKFTVDKSGGGTLELTVATGVGGVNAETCTIPVLPAPTCIVETRQVSVSSGGTASLTIVMPDACTGVFCMGNNTCGNAGTCVPLSSCGDDDCGDAGLDAAPPAADSGSPVTGDSATSTVAMDSSTPTVDSTVPPTPDSSVPTVDSSVPTADTSIPTEDSAASDSEAPVTDSATEASTLDGGTEAEASSPTDGGEETSLSDAEAGPG